MRTTRLKRNHKQTLPKKMKRRRKFNKNSNFMFDSKIRDNSVFDLETMNEVLRINKTARAEGKGSWKLMPKDSCEVYKKRQQKEAMSRSDSSDTEVDKPTREKKRPRRLAGRKVKKPTGTRSRKKNKEKSNDSSVSFSSRTTTNSMSSFSSYSEMDYE